MKLDELLADGGRLTNRKTVPVLLSSDLADECVQAQTEVDKAQRALDRAQQAAGERLRHEPTERAKAALADAEARLEAANQAAAEVLVDFVFESVGSDVWEEIVDAHPPTEDQKRQFGDQLWFNPRSFTEVAVALCLVDPELDQGEIDAYLESMRAGFPEGAPDSIPDARKLRASVPDIVWQQLFDAAVRVNRGPNAVPKSLSGSVTTPTSVSGSEPRSS